MISGFVLPLLVADLVTVTAAPGADCPSAAMVRDALVLQIPQLTASESNRSRPQYELRLEGASGAPVIRILDAGGTERLRRELPASVPQDCPALAQTVALVVERYLNDLQLLAPPPASSLAPPVPTRYELALGPRVRSGLPGAAGLGVMLRGGLRRNQLTLALDVYAGLGGGLDWEAAGVAGEGHVRDVGLQLVAGRYLKLGAGEAVALGGLGISYLSALRRTPAPERRVGGWEPSASAGFGYRLDFARQWFVLCALTGHWAMVRHVIVAGDDTVLATPRFFAVFSTLLGIAL